MPRRAGAVAAGKPRGARGHPASGRRGSVRLVIPELLREQTLGLLGALGVFTAYAALARPPRVPRGSAALLFRVLNDGRSIRVRDEATIGRSHEYEIVLEDSRVSRRHACVTRRGAQAWVEDVGSRNGTYVNGRQIESAAELRPGDRIEVGASAVEFVGMEPWK
ncbi:FHA domain-containing protein [bacterium]|nr:MAG: FHA domain-containing protein [bacterium]